MLELLDEIEQHVRSNNGLPDSFFLVNPRHLHCLDQLPRSRSSCPRAERVQEDVRVLVNLPTNQVGKVDSRALFPQRVEQQPEFGVSLVTIPEQNGERLVFHDDRRSPDITLDRIEFFKCRTSGPVKHSVDILSSLILIHLIEHRFKLPNVLPISRIGCSTASE